MPVAVVSPPRLDNYDVDDLSDDPFRSPSPPPSKQKKRKAAPESSAAGAGAGLGLEEEVSVQKRARAPAVKLDEERLLGPGGIPRLRARAARHLRLRGRGHEFADAERLLAFYQFWLDDLFPKARFLDALAMVEKAGHRKRVVAARGGWIDEAKPKPSCEDGDGDDGDGGDGDEGQTAQRSESAPAAAAPAAAPAPPTRPRTPVRDVPDDDDLYDATPRVPARAADALSAQAGRAEADPRPQQPPSQQPPVEAADADEDDLDALIAEAEEQDRAGGDVPSARSNDGAIDFAEEEAAMAEMAG